MYENRYRQTLERRLGVAKAEADALIAGGVTLVKQVRAMTDEAILRIKGVGPATLDKIRRKG